MNYFMMASFFLMIGCVCRVRLLSFQRSGLMWIVLYTLLVSVAAKLMLDLLFIGKDSAFLGFIVAVGDVHLITTWRLWRGRTTFLKDSEV